MRAVFKGLILILICVGISLSNSSLLLAQRSTQERQYSFSVGSSIKEITEPDGSEDNRICWVVGVIVVFLIIAAMGNTSSTLSSKDALKDKVYQKFGGELQSVCRDLRVPYMELLGETEKDRTASLVDYLYRRNKIKSLLEYCEKYAPGQGWDKYQDLTPKHKDNLLDTLRTRFNYEELRDLSIETGIDYDKSLEGVTLEEKAQSLKDYCYRHNCFERLTKVGKKQRDDINWHLLNPEGPETESDLTKVLSDRFNKPELHALCADLGVDYQKLAGTTLKEKVQALVDEFAAKGDLQELVKVGRKRRSEDIDWNSIRI